MHVVGTAGHVDHGKSTLVERLTGIDPDRFAEEKRRGLTIDLGFAWLELPSGREIGLIDVPGHERFIRNMLAGAGGVSVCLFVVAANEGWKPQSAEHLAILDLLNVRHGVVALTKVDLVDSDSRELVAAEVEERLTPSSLAGIPIVGCSAVTGEGVDELRESLDDAIASAPPTENRGRPRLWIDRVFTIGGSGTVVTGTLMGGLLRSGNEIEIAPRGRHARVRSIQSHKRPVDEIGAGNRVALNLAGLERADAERGDAVVMPGAWRTTSRVDALVRVSPEEIAGRSHELTGKGAHLLYVGSAETPVRIKLLDRPNVVSGGVGFAQLQLRDPLPLGPGDRFVLRDAGRILTFGGGVVLDPVPAVAKRGDGDRLALLQQLVEEDPQRRLRALLNHAGEIDTSELLVRSGADAIPDDVAVLDALVISGDRLEELQRSARERLTAYHSARPLEHALAREALRVELGLEGAVFDALLDRMADIVQEGAGVRLAAHRVGLNDQQRGQRDRLIGELEDAAFQPPLGSELQVDPELLRSLVQSGELTRIDTFYLTAARAAEARARVREQIEKTGPVTVAQIRDLLGTSRKYAVPLSEWLDATGATIRRGDVRILGPNP